MSEIRVLTVEALEHWALFGAQWRVLDISEEHATVELCACTGEPVERLQTRDPEMLRYLRRTRHATGTT